jgi:cytosine/adenosine deaminase-related metal-dependent hydrolase
MLVSRLVDTKRLMIAREALRMATVGGARALGRDDIGTISVGSQADIAFFRPSGVAGAGFENDPIAGLVFAAPRRVERLMVQGRTVVEGGRLVTADEEEIAARHRAAVRRIVQ